MAMTAESADAARIPEWTLGERMQKARQTAGLSRDYMARLVNKKVKTIIAWETGARNVGNALAVLEVWAQVTSVSYAWLLTGGVTRVTYWGMPAVVEDNSHPRLPMELPPSTTTPLLAVVE